MNDYLNKIENGFIITSNFGNQEFDNAFINDDGSLLILEDLDEAIQLSEDEFFGTVVSLGN